MHRIVFVAICAVCLVATTGCKKKPPVQAPTDDAVEVAAPAPQAEEPKTEVAQGDLRDLLLTLSRVHFGLDSSELVEQTREALDKAANALIEHPEVSLFVDGHTDERGTTEHNMALSERRAKAVVEHLDRLGVPKERLSVVSYGEEKPITPGADQVALAKNRRVDFRLMRGDIQLVLEEGTLLDDAGNPIAAKAE